MAKKITLIACTFLIIIATIVIANIAFNRPSDEPRVDEVIFEEGHTFSTDDLIKVSESTKYQDATISEKEDMLRVVTDAMVEDNVITEYGFQLSDNPPCIWIKYIDGRTVVFQLEDYPENQD
ncbi:MAG: hypothetical protein J6X94_07520 [Lachnospiraceae bacterium]|nr:hypothetical protein [Lachnospiraceae bacterium]